MRKFESLNALLCNATFVLFNGDLLRVDMYNPDDNTLYCRDEDTDMPYEVLSSELEFPRDKVYVSEEGTYL